MFVIVEGCDGSGKTTLIKKLRRTTKRHVLILSRANPPETLTDIYRVLAWVGRRPRALDLIMERHPFIGEWIYGSIVRNEDKVARHYPTFDSRIPLLLNADYIIYCRPDHSNIINNIESNPDVQMEGVIENLGAIISAYDMAFKVLEQRTDKIIRYDYANPIDLEYLWNSQICSESSNSKET